MQPSVSAALAKMQLKLELQLAAMLAVADFSCAAAHAHSMLWCTASPHGPLCMAYLLFGSPWASCSHLVFSHSSQFALIPFVHLPPCFHLIV